MANPDRPNGFRAVPPFLGTSLYQKDASASAIYQGDFVIGEADGSIDVATAGATGLIGVADGYTVASTADSLVVHDAIDQVYVGQDDGAGTTPAQTHVGNNADILATAGDSTLKQSRQEIDISTVNTTTQQLRLKEFYQHSEYSIGANSLWKVVMNEHVLNDTTGV